MGNLDTAAPLSARGWLCLMSNTSSKFVHHGCSGNQTHPCSHRAVAICARVLGSARTSAGSRPPEQTPSCATRARRGFFLHGLAGLRASTLGDYRQPTILKGHPIQNKTYPPLNLLRFPPWLTNLDRQTCIDPLIGLLRTYKSRARRSCPITLTGNRGRSVDLRPYEP